MNITKISKVSWLTDLGIRDRRKIHRTGSYSRAIIIPANLKMGDEATLAGNRLLLVDPRGEIHEEALLQFLEDVIEPRFWPWIQEKEVERDG